MDWQLTLAVLVVVVSSAYLAWRGWRTWRAAQGGSCGGCGCTKAPATQTSSTGTFIPADQLGVRQRG